MYVCVYRDMVSGGVMSRCSVMVCGMLVTAGIGHGMSCTLRNTKASFLLGRCGSLIVHGAISLEFSVFHSTKMIQACKLI